MEEVEDEGEISSEPSSESEGLESQSSEGQSSSSNSDSQPSSSTNNNATRPVKSVGAKRVEKDGTMREHAEPGPSTEKNAAAPFQFEQFAQFMQQRGLMLVAVNQANTVERQEKMPGKGKSGKNNRDEAEMDCDVGSMVMIYKQAVASHRQSTLSEEDLPMDTSDESDNIQMMDLAEDTSTGINNHMINFTGVTHRVGIEDREAPPPRARTPR